MSLQDDIERLDLSRAEIFFRLGKINKADMESEIEARVTAGMKDQYGWQLDSCTATFLHGFVDVVVTNGKATGKLSLEVPSEVEVVG